MVNPDGSITLWIKPDNCTKLKKLQDEFIKTHKFQKDMKFGVFVNNLIEHVIETHDLLKEIESS